MATVRVLLWWDAVRTSYWFVPTLLCLTGGILAVLVVAFDEKIDNSALRGYWWIFSGGAEGARTLLSTVAGSVITVAGVTFSITMAVLSQTSSQFGPRLLRGFLGDVANQMVLGVFLATFLYCLLVLRTVRSVEETYFVPHVAVTGGVALALVSLYMLVFFIHHVTQTIQISNIIRSIADEIEGAIDRLFPERIGHEEGEPAPEITEGDLWEASHAVRSKSSGYVQAVDGEALMDFAQENDLTFRVVRGPGQFVSAGSVLGQFVFRSGFRAGADESRAEALANRVRQSFTVGDQRTVTQDVRFAMEQLVEVGVRALSPGINDPYTAIMCLDRLSIGLCRLAERHIPSAHRRDDDGVVRVIADPLTFEEAADLCFESIRYYGRGDMRLIQHLLGVIAAVGECAGAQERRDTLAEQARRTWKAALEGSQDGTLPQPVEANYRDLLRRLTVGRQAEDESALGIPTDNEGNALPTHESM